MALAANIGIALVFETADVGQAYAKDIVSRQMTQFPEPFAINAIYISSKELPDYFSDYLKHLTATSTVS